LRYQLHSVEGRAKCPTVPQLCGLVIGTRVAEQGSKLASKVIRLFKCLKIFNGGVDSFVIKKTILGEIYRGAARPKT